jgi:uncharacterized membrane protein SpoIIM required for sporulation
MFGQRSHSRNYFKTLALKTAQTFNTVKLTVLDSVPFLIACAVLLSVISLKSPTLLFCLLLGSLIAVVMQQIGYQMHLPKRWLIVAQITAVAVILSLFWLDWFAAPAQAQFFGKAEDFFERQLVPPGQNNAGTQAAVSLVFNVLRAIFLLYIAISLIGVVNALRKDEDWQSIARTPLLVVVAVTVADVLTGFIIGNPN